MTALAVCTTVGAQDIPHEVIELDCETCHTTESFTDVSFDHDRYTDYPLVDRHRDLDCRACHSLADFSRVGQDCSSCHTDIHAAKLGPDCSRCHSTAGWQRLDAIEIHFGTEFPMQGRHALLDCEACHTGFPRGDLANTDARCVACHQSDYLAVSSPNHVTAGFSTDCQTCHQMNRFRPALLADHDPLFPIYSGAHRGEWADCSTCHNNPGTFTEFTCLVCHEHRQSEMDATHAGITGYAYTSPDCYFCHPRGEAGDFREHDAQFFPIFSGPHDGEWEQCSTCHTVALDRKVFDCLSCHAHRQTEMDGKHGSMTGYSYTSSACHDCHPDGLKGEFTAHDAEFFPIFSGAHGNEWADCETCHDVPLDRSQFSCLTCHDHSQALMDDKHLGEVDGYAYESTACFDCHPDGSTEE
jgi:hypothetical protein